MPLTFQKLKKEKKGSVKQIERFAEREQRCGLMWLGYCVYEWAQALYRSRKEESRERARTPLAHQLPLSYWYGMILKKWHFFLRGQGLHRKSSLPKGKVRLITIREKPLRFLHYTWFIYFSVFLLLQPNTFFLVLLQ